MSALRAGLLVVAAVAVDVVPLSAQPQYPPDIPEATVEVFKSVEGVDLKVWVLAPEGRDPDRAVPAMVLMESNTRSSAPSL